MFLCPTLAKPSIRADDPLDYGDFKAKGKPLPDGLAWCMTYPFNMLSRCPAITLPSGFGRTYDDVRVFRAAAAFEKAAPWLCGAKQRPKV